MTEYDKNWDAYGKSIAEKKDAPEWGILRLARETHWREFFTDIAGKKILDAGCGHGEYVAFALADKASVWAFDYSEEMVTATRERLERQGLQAEELYRGSVTSIPHEDASFDVVFCLAVLDHLPEADRVQAMREFYRVLKPGGTLYLDVPNRLALHWRLAFLVMRLLGMYPGGKIHFVLPWEIRSLARRHGFQPKASLGLTFCPPLSGIYTTDIRRITFLPEALIRPLDRLYLKLEQTMRCLGPFKALCWHYFLKCRKE